MFALKSCRCVAVLLICSVLGWSQAAKSNKRSSSPEARTAAYFESIKNQPSRLMDFLHDMPKGADLHNHLSGAVYAESFIRWAVEDGLCINRSSSTFVTCDHSETELPASAALSDVVLYGQLLDAFSMRGWLPARESGHDHFFATFGKFGAATNGHTAEMLTEVRARAARENLQYLEVMFNPDNGQAAALGKRVGWTDDLSQMRGKLLAGGLPEIVNSARQGLDQIESRENQELRCGTQQADPGCAVQARYLYQVARGLPKEMVYAQILAGFEMASRDPRVVGLNLVMAEDWYVPVHDFKLHMKIIDYLHSVYPKVHITLHAGELTPEIAAPEELFHIRASVEEGHAERIGHGVDVMDETNPQALLKEMANRNVLVEVCLTSNDVILGVSGTRHPLLMYLKFGVPVTLATDDEGVSRSSMTQEYQRAVETYHFNYSQLKKFARASLAYSFLPGAGLWQSSGPSACQKDSPRSAKVSADCEKLLSVSARARAQWALEKALANFESRF
jgi:adenosine deaminase